MGHESLEISGVGINAKQIHSSSVIGCSASGLFLGWIARTSGWGQQWIMVFDDTGEHGLSIRKGAISAGGNAGTS